MIKDSSWANQSLIFIIHRFFSSHFLSGFFALSSDNAITEKYGKTKLPLRFDLILYTLKAMYSTGFGLSVSLRFWAVLPAQTISHFDNAATDIQISRARDYQIYREAPERV